MDTNPAGEKSDSSLPHLPTKPKRAFNPDAYRAWVWIAVAICSLFTLIGLSSVGDPTSAEAQLSAAELTKSSNDSRTQGAPQQQVVNGWFLVDSVPIISEQLEGIHQAGVYNSRLYFLALIVILGVSADFVGRSFGVQYNSRIGASSTASE